MKESVFSWSSLYVAISKCIVSYFYFLYFNLALLTESAYVKVNFSSNIWDSAIEAVILFLSWNTLHVTFSKCKVSWFWLPYFNLSLFTQIVCVKGILFIVDYFCGFYFSTSYSNSVSYIPLFWKLLLLRQNETTILLAWPTLYIIRSRYSVS